MIVDEVPIEINEKQPDGTRVVKVTMVESVVGVVDAGTGAGAGGGVASGNGTSDEFEAKARELAENRELSPNFEAFKDAAMAAGLASGDVARFKSRILAESGVWAEVRGA